MEIKNTNKFAANVSLMKLSTQTPTAIIYQPIDKKSRQTGIFTEENSL